MDLSDVLPGLKLSTELAHSTRNCSQLDTAIRPSLVDHPHRRQVGAIAGLKRDLGVSYIRVNLAETTRGAARGMYDPLLRTRNMPSDSWASYGTAIDYTASLLLPYQ